MDPLSQPGGSLYNIEGSDRELITLPGGFPLASAAGEVSGVLGVSGSTVENNHCLASAWAGVL